MNEENTTIMPPEKQIVQDDRDARAEEVYSWLLDMGGELW